MAAPELIASKLEDIDGAGRLRTRGVFRRLEPELRAEVARQLVGRTVVVVTKYDRDYRGDVITVAQTTDGNVSHVLIVKEPGYWPMALSLATIDSIAETR
jgi:hypothetical protein